MFCLQSATDSEWLELVIANTDKLLADHAYCEQKAAASAMSLINKYPDDPFLVKAMLKLAHEELEHFELLYDLLQRRGIPLGTIDKDPYVVALLPLCRKHGKDALVDRLLVASLIEARSAERFRLLADHLPDEELRAMYKDLFITESRHHTVFVNLAANYAPKEAVKARLDELSKQEAEIVARLPVAPRMH
ncbi:MAG: tRNA-(ms[2]io[6]A)-hydroxylase [Candidatus Sericytochromatia bacterium]